MDQGPDAGRRSARGRRRATLLVAVAVAAVVALVAAGCSDDEGEGGDTDAEETTTTVSETTTTLSDEEFGARIAEFDAAVAEAGTDLCAVFEVGNEVPPPAPASSAQVRQAVEGYFVPLLRTLAASVPDAPEAAEPFRAAADQLAAEAEEAGYPEDFFAATDGQGPPSLTSEEFLAANQVFAQLVQERCVAPEDGAGPETTIPEG